MTRTRWIALGVVGLGLLGLVGTSTGKAISKHIMSDLIYVFPQGIETGPCTPANNYCTEQWPMNSSTCLMPDGVLPTGTCNICLLADKCLYELCPGQSGPQQLACPPATTSTTSTSTSTSSTSSTSSTLPGATTSTSSTVTTTSTSSTTSSTVAGSGSAPVDWTQGAHVIAAWPGDNSSTNTGPGTSCNGTPANCDLNWGGSELYTNTSGLFTEGTYGFLLNGASGFGPPDATPYVTRTPSAFSLCLWAYNTTNTGFPYIAASTDFANSGWQIDTNQSNGNVNFEVYQTGVGGHIISKGSLFPQNSWGHLCVDTTTAAQHLYGNGGTVVTGAATYTPQSAPGAQLVFSPSATRWTGYMDDLYMTSAILTAQQDCRIGALTAKGLLGWCDQSDATNYRACTSDADCGGRTGACDVTSQLCIGRLRNATGPGSQKMATSPCSCTTTTCSNAEAKTAMGNCNAVAP